MIIPLLILRLYTLRHRDICGVAFVLFLGLVSITAATIRVVSLMTLNFHTCAGPLNTRRAELLSFTELSVVFLAACAPSFRLLFRKIRERGEAVRYVPDGGHKVEAFELSKVISIEQEREIMPEGGSWLVLHTRSIDP